MKTIAVFVNERKPSAARVLAALKRQAERFGLVLAELEHPASGELEKMVDMLFVLGGDGTMLKAVRMLDGRDVPVLGVNLGSLGFLTSVAECEMERALQCVAAGDFAVDTRTLADCIVERGGEETGRYRALNDIVITQGPSPRIITLDILIDDAGVLSCKGDGVIVSTPTGSTGHSLSAGGPILHPDSEAFVISLICPHTLSARPLVVPNNKHVTIVASESSGDLMLSVDGQVGGGLKTGDAVRICRSRAGAHFVHLPGHSYFSVLRQKLHWRGSAL